jgi:hypothetical protein
MALAWCATKMAMVTATRVMATRATRAVATAMATVKILHFCRCRYLEVPTMAKA